MKKALPYIYHVACSLLLIALMLFITEFVFNIEFTHWITIVLALLLGVLSPKFNSVETQSGTKIQVKWFLFKKPKFI